MHITALGGADEIGASCLWLDIAGYHIVVDCGVRPNALGLAALPAIEALPAPDLVMVTHAHLDHSGALPVLRRRFPSVPILVTPGTYTLLKILLADAVRVMGYTTHLAEPLYDWEAARALIHSLTIQEADEWFYPLPDVAACFCPAGHILGAAMVLLDTPEGQVVISGDVSLMHQRTVRGARVPEAMRPTDVLILESTYGAQQHPERGDEERALARTVGQVVVDGGVALVPAFAVGRAQEVILTLRAMQRSGAIPEFPIYIDGMVRAVCGAYHHRWQDLSPDLQALLDAGVQPFRDKWVRAVSPAWRDSIPKPGEPCCIVSSSGMLSGGPSVGYAQRLLGDPRNAILFPGYTDEESPGRKLQMLKPGDSLELDGQQVCVQARVEKVGLSAHADGPQLARLVDHLKPRQVVLVHGEAEARQALGQELETRCPVYLPANGETWEALPPPRWMGQVRPSRWYRGQVRIDPAHIAIEVERGMLSEAAWGRRYAGHAEVAVRFLGEQMMIEAGRLRETEAVVEQELEPVKTEPVSVLVEAPMTEEEQLAGRWYESGFACILCGASKRYRVNLAVRQVEWECTECGAQYAELMLRLRDKDLHKMALNDKLRLLQFIRVSVNLHEPVLPENWQELVGQSFWERWLG